MYGHVKLRTAALLVLVFLLPAGVMAAGVTMPDRLILHSSKQIGQIEVTEAKVSGVKYVKHGTTAPVKEIAFDQIKEIKWGDARQLNRVIADVRTQRWETGLKDIGRCPDKGPRPFWYEPFRAVLHGRCLFELKKYAEALPLFEKVVSGHADSFYVLDAILYKAKAHKALNQAEQAAKAYEKLDPLGNYAKLGAGAPYGKLWQLRGRVEMAGLYAQVPGKLAQAERMYDKLAEVAEAIQKNPPRELKASLDDVSDIHQVSLMGKTQVLIKNKKSAEARKWIDQVGPKIKKKAARLKMYVALGDLAMEDADNAKDATQKKVHYKEAVLAYMRVYILFPDYRDDRAHAMSKAVIASYLMDTDVDKKRARVLYKELAKEFPNSRELEAAKQVLGVR